MLEQIVVGLIVAAALVWLIWRLVRGARSGGCTCDRADACPFAGEDRCAFGSPEAFGTDQSEDPSESN